MSLFGAESSDVNVELHSTTEDGEILGRKNVLLRRGTGTVLKLENDSTRKVQKRLFLKVIRDKNYRAEKEVNKTIDLNQSE